MADFRLRLEDPLLEVVQCFLDFTLKALVPSLSRYLISTVLNFAGYVAGLNKYLFFGELLGAW